jgi:hypothetical protein
MAAKGPFFEGLRSRSGGKGPAGPERADRDAYQFHSVSLIREQGKDRSMTKPATGDGELFIHLDVGGLAALMKAIEAAMTDGRGQLSLRGGGMVVSSGGSSRFAKVTVTFAGPADPPDDAWRSGRPDPEPEPRLPVLALQN